MAARAMNVSHAPTEVDVLNVSMSRLASGAPIMAPPPKPMMAMPVAMPRRSGNHFPKGQTGGENPGPGPGPADAAAPEPNQPELVDIAAEGADHETAAPAQCSHHAGLARTGPLEPAAPDRRRDPEQHEE